MFVSDDIPETPSPPTPQRKRLFGQRQQSAPLDPSTIEVIAPSGRKAAMQGMDRTERQVGYIAALFAAAMGVLGLLIFPKNHLATQKPVHDACTPPYHFNTSTKVCENLVSNQLLTIAAVSVVFAVAIALSVRFNRRIAATFSALLSGVAFTSFSISVGAPLLIFGGWLFLRARRIQKWGTVQSREVAVLAAEDRRVRKAGGTSTKGMTASEYRASLAENKSARSSGSTKGPDTSKRYTPKAAPKKRPAPAPVEKPPSKWRTRLEGLDKER